MILHNHAVRAFHSRLALSSHVILRLNVVHKEYNVFLFLFFQDRWMLDYLCDFRQRLDRTADALSGSMRQPKRHRERSESEEEKWCRSFV